MPWSGLEPLCLSAPPPQDGVSTNFTTRAKLHLIAGSQRRVAPAACYSLPAASCSFTGPTGLEPATSRVTVECSNQTELRPQLLKSGSKTPSSIHFPTGLVVSQVALHFRFCFRPSLIAPRG